MHFCSLTPRWLFSLLLASLAVPLFAASNQAATTEDVTELPKFVVEGERIIPPQEPWKRTEIEGFEVLTSASERNTKRFLRDFQRLRYAVEIVWPAAKQNLEAGNSYLILCGIGKDMSKFLPAEKSDDRWYSSSIYLQDKELTSIIVDLHASEVTMDNGEVLAVDPYRAFYEEYFRFLIRRGIGRKPPVWLEEGLVAVLSSIEFDKTWIELGKIESVTISATGTSSSTSSTSESSDESAPTETTPSGTVGQFNVILARRSLIPFEAFFAREKPTGQDAITWKAQAQAFCHMCLFGENNKYQKPFLELAAKASKGPVTEAVFRECFGMDFKEMGLTLRSYLQFTVYKPIEMRARKGSAIPEPPAVELTDASDADIGRIKGETLRLGGHFDEAQSELIAPYIRGSRDPRFLGSLGLNELISHKTERARKFLEAAYEGKCMDGRANVELARLRIDETLKSGKPFTGATLEAVLAPLNRAATRKPMLADCVQLMAQTWLSTDAVPTKAQIMPLIVGLQQYPNKTILAFLSAQVYLKNHYLEEANAIAEWGEKACTNPEGRERFKKLRATIAAQVPAKK